MNNFIKNKFSLDNRIILITGGAGFLGSRITMNIRKCNGFPIIIDNNLKSINSLKKKYFETFNQKLIYFKGDLSKPKQIKTLFKKKIDPIYKVDSLLNCASTDTPHTLNNLKNLKQNKFHTYPLDLIEKSFSLNLIGTINITQLVIGSIIKNNIKGNIINISSIYGIKGPDQSIYRKGFEKPIDYTISKASINGMTTYLANYYKNTKIRINSITLGGIENNMSKKFIENYSNKTLIGRMARLDDYDGAIIFLLSSSSEYMTGSNLIIDGGYLNK